MPSSSIDICQKSIFGRKNRQPKPFAGRLEVNVWEWYASPLRAYVLLRAASQSAAHLSDSDIDLEKGYAAYISNQFAEPTKEHGRQEGAFSTWKLPTQFLIRHVERPPYHRRGNRLPPTRDLYVRSFASSAS
jgi:hypothetical protein